MICAVRERNVNGALGTVLKAFAKFGIIAYSRNGPVIRFAGPMTITYTNPTERVLFSELRDANPYFHFAECLWMIAGRNDAAYLTKFTKQIDMYAGVDGTLEGAYGHRWKTHFGYDQITHVVDLLRKDADTRRAVLSMWDGRNDLLATSYSKDVPCNTHVYFEVFGERLNMTVCNRSNDAVWGALGANVVHMSFLQEFIAAQVGVGVGLYHQFTNNLHLYTDRKDVQRLLSEPYVEDDRYSSRVCKPLSLKAENESALTWERYFAQDCATLVDTNFNGELTQPNFDFGNLRTVWGATVAAPVLMSHAAYKKGNYEYAEEIIDRCAATDWAMACKDWLKRRERNRLAKEAQI